MWNFVFSGALGEALFSREIRIGKRKRNEARRKMCVMEEKKRRERLNLDI